MENGRDNNVSEMARDGLCLASLDAAVERSHADITAGRTKPAADVFDRLHAKYAQMAAERSEP